MIRSVLHVTFKSIRCEVAAAQLCDGSDLFVAWALRCRADGGRDPLYDREGELYRTKSSTPSDAIDVIRTRLAARFGPEVATAEEYIP